MTLFSRNAMLFGALLAVLPAQLHAQGVVTPDSETPTLPNLPTTIAEIGEAKEVTGEDYATLPYKDLIKIAQRDASQDKESQVYVMKISSRRGVASSEIQLFLDRPDAPLMLPIDESGYFQVPHNEELAAENPDLVSNQPKGSLDLELKVSIPKTAPPKVVDGRVTYQELFRQLREMEIAMKDVDKNFGKANEQQLALQIMTNGEPIVIEREFGSREIPSKNGSVWLIYEIILAEENPAVKVPEAASINIRPVTAEQALSIRAQ